MLENALRNAQRRKWAGTALIVVLGIALVGGAILNKIRSDQQKALITEFLLIESDYQTEIQRFQAALDAQSQKPSENGPTVPDNSHSTAKFIEFFKKHDKDPLGWVAALRSSTYLLQSDRAAEAEALLKPILSYSLKDLLIQVKIRRVLAGIYAEQGKYNEAIEQLTFAEQIPDNPIVNEMKLFHAQVLYLADKKPEAGQLLRSLSQSDFSLKPNDKTVAHEAAMWLGYWGL